MQPLKITILGDFWDCQIYRGRLYVWTMDGRLLTYKWDEFVTALPVADELKLALECGFCRGDYLYNPEFKRLFADREIMSMLRSKFAKLSRIKFEFHLKDMSKYLYGEQSNPFKSLAGDSEIYKNRLFYASELGLWHASIHRSNKKYPTSSRPEKIWDCKLLSVKASNNGRFALSAGDEGLFEYDSEKRESLSELYAENNFKEIERDLLQLSRKHSFFSNWNYSSIYSTSNLEESYMMLFGWSPESRNEFKLKYKELINEKRIFQTEDRAGSQLSWGANNKIYKASSRGGLEVVDYIQKYVFDENEEENAFTSSQHVPFQPWKGNIVSGGVAYFGVIIECENALVVMTDDHDFFNIPADITRWRVYPRSIRYENHLHVIAEDRLDIYSFNHDYFRSQKDKKIGMRWMEKNKF